MKEEKDSDIGLTNIAATAVASTDPRGSYSSHEETEKDLNVNVSGGDSSMGFILGGLLIMIGLIVVASAIKDLANSFL